MGTPINIFFATDNNYICHTATTMASVLSNAAPSDEIIFHIPDNAISDENKQKIEQMKALRDFKVFYPQLQTNWGDSFKSIKRLDHVNMSTYIKLLIPQLCPDVDRVIYLDSDLIVLGSLAELASMDIKGFYFAAVEDSGGFFHAPKLGFKSPQIYFNSGVLLINCALINQEYSFYMQTIHDHIQKNGHKYTIAEQDVLNDAFQGRIEPISYKWNMHHFYHDRAGEFHPRNPVDYKASCKGPQIVHFIMHLKPWVNECKHPDKHLYFEYRVKTPWGLSSQIANQVTAQISGQAVPPPSPKPVQSAPANQRKVYSKKFLGITYWKIVYENYRIRKTFLGIPYSNEFDYEPFFEDRVTAYLQALSTKQEAAIAAKVQDGLSKYKVSQQVFYATQEAPGHRELISLYNDFRKNYVPVLPEKFDALTKGLDNESYSTVVLILNRMRQVAPTAGVFDIFTKDEKEQISQLRANFWPKIISLSGSLFEYNHYRLPINRWETCVFYFKSNIDHVKNIDYVKNKDIIDAGAYVGDSALLLSPLTKKTVYSFEPSLQHIDWMTTTLSLNNIRNVKIVPAALGEEKSTGELTYSYQGSSLGNPFNPHLEESKTHETVNIITLDSYVAEHNLDVGLIKTDLEGFEQPFLRGAINTIKTQRPILLISIYHSMDDFFNIKPLIESWNLGYEFKIVKPVDDAVILETMLIAEVPRL